MKFDSAPAAIAANRPAPASERGRFTLRIGIALFHGEVRSPVQPSGPIEAEPLAVHGYSSTGPAREESFAATV